MDRGQPLLLILVTGYRVVISASHSIRPQSSYFRPPLLALIDEADLDLKSRAKSARCFEKDLELLPEMLLHTVLSKGEPYHLGNGSCASPRADYDSEN